MSPQTARTIPFKPLLTLALACGFIGAALPPCAGAQQITGMLGEPTYGYVTSQNGVRFSWGVKQDVRSSPYIAVFKIENTSDRVLDISYRVSFSCADGTRDDTDPGGAFTFAAHSNHHGEMAGLYAIPCHQGAIRPITITVHLDVHDRAAERAAAQQVDQQAAERASQEASAAENKAALQAQRDAQQARQAEVRQAALDAESAHAASLQAQRAQILASYNARVASINSQRETIDSTISTLGRSLGASNGSEVQQLEGPSVTRDRNGLIGGSVTLTALSIVNDAAKANPGVDAGTVMKADEAAVAVGGVADFLGWRSRRSADDKAQKAAEAQAKERQRQAEAVAQAQRDSAAETDASRVATEQRRAAALQAAQAEVEAANRRMSRAMLDSTYQSLLAVEAALQLGDVQKANGSLSAAQTFRSAVMVDDSLRDNIAAVDTALQQDTRSVSVGNAVLVRRGNASTSSSNSLATSVARQQLTEERALAAQRAQATADSLARERDVALAAATERNKEETAVSVVTAIPAGAEIAAAAPTNGLEELGGRVITVRSFESSHHPPPVGARHYQSVFETAAARFILTEVGVGFVDQAKVSSVQLDCSTKRADSTVARQHVRVSHASDVSVFLFTVGIGWGAPNRIEPGRYVTSCDQGNVEILADSFVVTGVTAHSAFEAAESSARRQEWDSAAKSYAAAVRLDSTIASYHYGLGVALAAVKDDSGAASAYSVAVRLAPDEPRYHIEYADVLERLHRLADAEQEYRQVIRLDPRDARRHMVLADLLLQIGRPTAALTEYRNAAAIDPGEPYYKAQIEKLSGMP